MSTTTKARLVLGACLIAGAARASAGVTVDFVKPDDFSDLPREIVDRRQALDDFAAHFKALGKDLRPDQDLAIEVRDIDLAGHLRRKRFGGEEIRILNTGADWPRMELHYVLSEGGKVVASGDAHLADKAYADQIDGYPRDTRWPYEMRMIDKWWRATIVPLAQTGR